MSDSNKGQKRDALPDPMKREIRQRCGFGCVLCGFPLYEYEHLEGWAKVKRHVAEEITLLCDKHHSEKTKGLLPIEAVREADRNPFNKKEGQSSPYDLHYSGDRCEVDIGGNRLLFHSLTAGSQVSGVAVDGIPLISFTFDQGQLFLTVRLFDDDDNLVLLIDQNCLQYSVEPWDIEFVGRNLVLREKPRRFFLDVLFEPPHRVAVQRGRFQKAGFAFYVRPDQVCCGNDMNQWKNCGASGSATSPVTFWSVGDSTPPGMSIFRIEPSECCQRYVIHLDEVHQWLQGRYTAPTDTNPGV